MIGKIVRWWCHLYMVSPMKIKNLRETVTKFYGNTTMRVGVLFFCYRVDGYPSTTTPPPCFLNPRWHCSFQSKLDWNYYCRWSFSFRALVLFNYFLLLLFLFFDLGKNDFFFMPGRSRNRSGKEEKECEGCCLFACSNRLASPVGISIQSSKSTIKQLRRERSKEVAEATAFSLHHLVSR